jgi:hypothetical protein
MFSFILQRAPSYLTLSLLSVHLFTGISTFRVKKIENHTSSSVSQILLVWLTDFLSHLDNKTSSLHLLGTESFRGGLIMCTRCLLSTIPDLEVILGDWCVGRLLQDEERCILIAIISIQIHRDKRQKRSYRWSRA